MILFENDGTLDVRAITTMGISAKDKERSTIGYFGTGMKYAIAVLLRTGHEIWIHDGMGQQFYFTSKSVTVRDEKFNIVCMQTDDGEKELGFTTDLGKNWEVWQAFRELYCNATDEGGMISNPDNIKFDARKELGIVRVMVVGKDIERVWRKKSLYILDPKRDPKYDSNGVQVFRRQQAGKGRIFCQGICIAETPEYAEYDYNFQDRIALTEDRTVKHSFEIHAKLARALFFTHDAEFIEDLIYNGHRSGTTFEPSINLGYCYETPGDKFLDVIEYLRLKFKDNDDINGFAKALHRKHRAEKQVMPEESVELTSVEQMQLDRAISFGKKQLHIEFDEFPIIVCDDLGSKNNLGRADMKNNKIYLSRALFSKGTKYVLIGLLEEHTHLKHRVSDETLEQKWIYLELIATLAEAIAGEPI